MPARAPRREAPTEDLAIAVLALIRRKAGFLENILLSDIDLTHQFEREEVAVLAGDIFKMADTFLERADGEA